MTTFFQVGAIPGLLQGIYDGDMDCHELAKHGNIGLGTFNGVDGEMVVLDGIIYRMDIHGNANKVNPSTLTPFAVISDYNPTLTFPIKAAKNSEELNAIIDAKLPSLNIFYMIRIDADITWIKLRSEGCQALPYKPLAEALPAAQHIFELKNIKGTLVTSRCPAYSGGITVSGFHHHFINAERTIGGHAFDVELQNAIVNVTALRVFNINLMDTPAFNQANLAMDTESLLKKTE